MQFRITRAQGQTVNARAALGLLALVWLNLAAQPCVAAMSPPGVATQEAPILANSNDVAEAKNVAHRYVETSVGVHGCCPHCALTGHQACTDFFQCAASDVISATKSQDVPASAGVVSASVQTFEMLPYARDSVIDPCADSPMAGPPLIVRYCVYQI